MWYFTGETRQHSAASGSEFTEDGRTFYLPVLSCWILDATDSGEEYPGVHSWQIVAEEDGN
jgi:hypothetical protein